MNNTKIDKEYTASSIQVLEDLEAVRKRPGMFIGNVDSKGLHHLIWEIVDNAIDEVLAGFASNIVVTLHSDSSVTVSDDGRGIPIGIHPKTNKSTVETVFTVLHAGGKFGGSDSVYKVSGGLHGVGASVVNALSKFLEARVFKNGNEYFIRFDDGGTKSDGLKKITKKDDNSIKNDKNGTVIHFLPNFDHFNEGAKDFDPEIIKARLREFAYLNSGLKIEFISEINPKDGAHYFYKNGIKDFVTSISEKAPELIIPKEIYVNGEIDDIFVEVAFQYVKSYQSKIYSFVNNIVTPEGGTHESGFISALYWNLNNYVKQNFSLKEQFSFTREDLKEGLNSVISIRHPNPMYEGQTKNKFSNPEVRKIVREVVSEKFENFLLENPIWANLIINKVKLAAKARLSAAKARELTRKDDYLISSTLPGKLADCSSKDRNKTELFIVEGDSAGGSAKMGRNREIQAILPLRGKVINAEKTRIDKLLANKEITSLITAIGTGIENEFDLSKLRYDKIIIMTDADVDGSHIRILLLTFFYRYFRELIERGHVYIAQPPLYKIAFGKKEVYIYDDRDLDEFLENKKSENPNFKYTTQRYKGLGEMNYDQLWDTTMNWEKRKLLRVEISEIVSTGDVFTNLMGDTVAPRKEFILKNAKFANLDI